MTTPQDPPRRRKEKIRRAKQLAAWRAAKKDAAGPAEAPAKTATK